MALLPCFSHRPRFFAPFTYFRQVAVRGERQLHSPLESSLILLALHFLHTVNLSAKTGAFAVQTIERSQRVNLSLKDASIHTYQELNVCRAAVFDGQQEPGLPISGSASDSNQIPGKSLD